MEQTAIRARIKDIIGNVAGLDPERIGDHDTLREGLNLDSLSLLEIGVDIDYSFKLGLPDESYKELRGMDDMVALVEARLAELAGGAAVAQGVDVGVGAA